MPMPDSPKLFTQAQLDDLVEARLGQQKRRLTKAHREEVAGLQARIYQLQSERSVLQRIADRWFRCPDHHPEQDHKEHP
jgi:hypothetical protein